MMFRKKPCIHCEMEKFRSKDPDDLQMGEDLNKLFNSKEWRSVSHLTEKLRRLWTFKLLKLGDARTMEAIAIDRIKLISMVSALELFYSDIGNYIENYQQQERKPNAGRD